MTNQVVEWEVFVDVAVVVIRNGNVNVQNNPEVVVVIVDRRSSLLLPST